MSINPHEKLSLKHRENKVAKVVSLPHPWQGNMRNPLGPERTTNQIPLEMTQAKSGLIDGSEVQLPSGLQGYECRGCFGEQREE